MRETTEQETVRDFIVETLADWLGRPPAEVTDHATFDALGTDSLDVLELVLEVEDYFHIGLDDGALANVRTVGQFIALAQESAAVSSLTGGEE